MISGVSDLSKHPRAYPIAVFLLLIGIGAGLFVLAHRMAAGPASELPNPDQPLSNIPGAQRPVPAQQPAEPPAGTRPAPHRPVAGKEEPNGQPPAVEVVEKAPKEVEGFGGLVIGTITEVRDDGRAVFKVAGVADVTLGNAESAKKWLPGKSLLVQAQLYNPNERDQEEKLAGELKVAHDGGLTVMVGLLVDHHNVFSVGSLEVVKK